MMKRTLLACDLDNTLIYSRRNRREGDQCIEYIHEEPQGFISRKTVEGLRKINSSAHFVPITTRSVEQYLRIQWPEGCKPMYAITTNGAILLKNEKVVEEWRYASERMVDPLMNEIERLRLLCIAQERFIRCRVVDGMYLFAYAKDGVDVALCQREYQEMTELQVIASGRKIYFFPPMFHKGEAVRRFRSVEQFDRVFSAGDSIIDVPMLQSAQCAMIPNQGLGYAFLEQDVKICPKEQRFSEFVVLSVLDLLG